MEKSVMGIRETYYHSLIEDYQNEKVNSFLYRSFWAESIRELLKESLPPLPKKEKLGKQMEELNKGFLGLLTDEENGPEQMEEHFARLPEEVKDLLRVHLPQLPEGIGTLLREHFRQLPGEVKELLTGRFPWLLEEETSWLRYRAQIKSLLKETMRERPEWARKVLKQEPPRRTENKKEAKQEQETGRELKKERRDFWKELMLNDAGYEAGLITDTEYYLWLTEYLAVRKKYYTDISMEDGHTWLYQLLYKGLGRRPEESVRLEKIGKLEKEIEKLEQSRDGKESGKLKKIRELETLKKPEAAEKLRKADGKTRDKAGVGRDLEELAEKLRYEAETGGGEISGRLHGLKRRVKTKDGKDRMADYLLWLTGKLKKMAVHIEIRNWLQDNGYPIGDDGETQKQDEVKRLLQERRKQDSSMRRFAAYCDSEKGFDFIKKKEGGRKADEGWVVRNGFCVWGADGAKEYLQALVQALKQEGKDDFYIPLAVDLYSGCVFFLAGKGYYKKAYKKSGDADAFFCYDYLRLDERKDSEDSKYSAVAFRLQNTFDENAGKSYEDVLNDFKWYCGKGSDNEVVARDLGDGEEVFYVKDYNPRRKIKAYINEEAPAGAPEVFRWIFEEPEDLDWKPSPSPEAKKSFRQAQKKYAKQI